MAEWIHSGSNRNNCSQVIITLKGERREWCHGKADLEIKCDRFPCQFDEAVVCTDGFVLLG